MRQKTKDTPMTCSSIFLRMLYKSHGDIQLNLSTKATLGTEESSHCKEVAVVERWPLAEVQL